MSVQPAICTDLKVEGTMKDRKGKKIYGEIKDKYRYLLKTGAVAAVHMMEAVGCPTQTANSLSLDLQT